MKWSHEKNFIGGSYAMKYHWKTRKIFMAHKWVFMGATHEKIHENYTYEMLGKPMKLFHTVGFHGQYFMDYLWAILVINPWKPLIHGQWMHSMDILWQRATHEKPLTQLSLVHYFHFYYIGDSWYFIGFLSSSDMRQELLCYQHLS